MFRLKQFALLLPIVALTATQPGWSLSASQAESLIAREKIFEPATRVVPLIADNEALVRVILPLTEKASTDKYKINATLVAKALVLADKEIKKVKVRFFNGGQTDSFKEVLVRALDVKAFGSGAITADDLLGTLELIDGSEIHPAEAKGAPPPQAEQKEGNVGEGPLASERHNLLVRIQALKSRGVGLKPFMDKFSTLEDEAKRGDSAKLSDDMDSLSDSLTAQEKVLNEREKSEQQKLRLSKGSELRAALAASAASSTVPAPTSGSGTLLSELIQEFKSSGFGKYMPAPGPMMPERMYIRRHIHQLTERGINVDGLMPAYRNMEQLAATNRIDDLKDQIGKLCKAMNILPPEQGMAQDMHQDMHGMHNWHHHYHEN